jgi:cob(I)alamin adenosyltransferase
MKIYTKRGDRGQTDTIGYGRIDKNSTMIKLAGKIDSLSSFIGAAPTFGSDRMSKEKNIIQKDLYLIGTLVVSNKHSIELDIDKLEQWIDSYTDELPSINGFILPRGQWNIARAVCREAEIAALDHLENAADKEQDIRHVIKYLNRLSDYLFTIARYHNIVVLKKDEVYAA